MWPAAVLASLFALLAWRSWGTWADPLIDFGRELYVPWRLVEGDALYRDVAYFNGPLSPWANAVWFWLFGAGLRTLVVANLVIAALTTGVLYGLLRQLASRWAATIGAAAFVLLCVFSQFTRIRNYNFICPYSHEMTHGLLLSLLSLRAAWRLPRRRMAVVAGILLGLVFLTKPELAVAAAVGVGASAVCLGGVRSLITVALAAAIPPAVAVGLLSLTMPVSDAVNGCLAAWHMAGTAEIRELAFYRRGLGTFNIADSVTLMSVSLARWTVLLGVAYAILQLAPSTVPARRRAMAALCGGGLATLLFNYGFSWPLMERAFPVGLACLMAGSLSEAFRGTFDAEDRRGHVLRALWCLWALALLAKIALFSRISHYGFVLAAPALTTICLTFFDWLPAAAVRRKLPGEILPWFFAPIVAAYCLAYQCQQSVLVDRSTPLGAHADRLAAPADAAPISRAEHEILRRVRPEQTLAVLPEGVMLNYLTRRAAPTRYITWMPPELYFFGEQNMLRALRAAPPDWVLVAPRDFKEYGLPAFGAGYADSIARWIDANYEPVASWRNPTADESSSDWRLLSRQARRQP